MEVVGTAFSVAQTLLAALENSNLKEFMSIFGYESDLQDLKSMVSKTQAVFRDAEKTLTVSNYCLLEDLKDFVYEVDDLLDEFVTIVEQKQLLEADDSISKKMRSFIFRRNPFGVVRKMSKGLKAISMRLNAIIVPLSRFRIVQDPEPIRIRRPNKIPSYFIEGDIIGREQDLEKIVGMLLDPKVDQDLSFLSIVGIGGMGKTALAQLVYNHPMVEKAFPLRLWACVSDQDEKHLYVEEILSKILISTNDKKLDEGLTLGQMQSKLQQQLARRRYLIVLDDVWSEKRVVWRDLLQYFVGGLKGSWIVITTRSQQTATIIGDGPMYELQGLSEEESMQLFQMTAFGANESNPPNDILVSLGREIVDGCAGVPLAIRVMGSLLYGQGMSKRQIVEEIVFSIIRKKEEGIMSILQLSFHHLESPLKSCFRYCALFPKDFEMDKEMLIDLWIAQGYVVPLYEGQSVENAGQEYFSILLMRSFFQDIKRDELCEIVSCKMHDLMHDLAQFFSGKEIYVANTGGDIIIEKVRHFSTSSREYRTRSWDETRIRSYLHVGSSNFNRVKVETSFVEALVSCCRSLRALNLATGLENSLPNSIGTLLHLRYLDLSYNHDLKFLPNSISELHNLQTLNLKNCKNLKKLPKNLNKLVNLRVLDISYCFMLKYMPGGMNKMTCLHRLSDFIVGSEESFVSWKQWFDTLHNLKALKNLKGALRIHIQWPKDTESAVSEVNMRTRDILWSMEHLNSLTIEFGDEEGAEKMNDKETIALMGDLNPHLNLKILQVWDYHGTRMPNWASRLPNLVKLELHYCQNLKGWNAEMVEAQLQTLPCLPQLKSLRIENSPELTCIPLCPKLEELFLRKFNKRLVFEEVANFSPTIKAIFIDNVAWLNCLPMEVFQCLGSLEIRGDDVEKLGKVEKVFQSCSYSLKFLKLYNCSKLSSVVGKELKHLTALEELVFVDCVNLWSSEEKEGENAGIDFDIDIDIEPCTSLLPSLRTLTLCGLLHMENLPNWMQFLPALEILELFGCQKLIAMPNWMPILSSLRNLHVFGCSKMLERRCQKHNGVDWPLIQHIPMVTFEDCYE